MGEILVLLVGMVLFPAVAAATFACARDILPRAVKRAPWYGARFNGFVHRARCAVYRAAYGLPFPGIYAGIGRARARVNYYYTRARLALFRVRYIDGPVYAAGAARRIGAARFTIGALVCNARIALAMLHRDNRGSLNVDNMIGTVYRWGRVKLSPCEGGQRASLEILPDIMFFGVIKYIGNLIKTFGAFEPYARARSWLASAWPFRHDWNSVIKGSRAGTPDAIQALCDRINAKPWNIQIHGDDEGIVTVSIDWSNRAIERLGIDTVKYLTFALCMRATNNRARSAFSDLSPTDVDAIVYDCASARWAKTGRSAHTTRCVRSNNPAFRGTLVRQMGIKGGQWGRLAKTLTCYDEHDRDHFSGRDDKLAIIPGYSGFRSARNEYLYREGMKLQIPARLQLSADDVDRYEKRRADMLAALSQ